MAQDPKDALVRDTKLAQRHKRDWKKIADELGPPDYRRKDGTPAALTEEKGIEDFKEGIGDPAKMNQTIKLTCPSNDFVLDYIEQNAEFGFGVVAPRSGVNGTVFICGNGRHLKDHVHVIEKYGMHDQAHVWGCNGAANWLADNGVKLTHGFTTDSSDRMFEECWKEPPVAHYLLATCVNPKLTQHLIDRGNNITFFHNFTGVEGEVPRYMALYPTAPLVGEGLNSVNRALALADIMGFEKIYILGAVSHLDPKTRHMHAGGKTSTQQYVLTAEIDGKRYCTHADMLYSAIDLVKQQRAMGDRLEIIGDKDDLGMVLLRKPDSFLNRCISFR